MKRLIWILVAGLAVYLAPLGWLHLTQPIVAHTKSEPADAALIFGAVVRNGQISPLHRERLDTGYALWNDGKAKVLVVSNAPTAARVMRDYLIALNVPEAVIEVDTKAIRTPDTCIAELTKQPRSVIFVSQKFHLPRIGLQCDQLGVSGQLVMADNSGRAKLGAWTTLRVRGYRLIREATLTWGVILGIYP